MPSYLQIALYADGYMATTDTSGRSTGQEEIGKALAASQRQEKRVLDVQHHSVTGVRKQSLAKAYHAKDVPSSLG